MWSTYQPPRYQKFPVGSYSPRGWPYLTVIPPGVTVSDHFTLRVWPDLTDTPSGMTVFDRFTLGWDGQARPKPLLHVCFHNSGHFFISTEVKPLQKSQRTSATMTRSTHRHTRPCNKRHHYTPKRINMDHGVEDIQEDTPLPSKKNQSCRVKGQTVRRTTTCHLCE